MKKSPLLIALIIFIVFPVFAQPKGSKPASMLCPPIAYPNLSRLKEEEGTVHLLIKINEDATVGGVTIEKSSGHNRLDSAAVQLIQNCQFTAAVRDAVPYSSNVRQRFTFKLEGGVPKNNNSLSEDERLKMENLRRMASLMSPSNDFQTVPYSQRISQRIMPNIVFTDEVEGNPSAIVEIKNTEDGKIVGIRLVESSGSKGWDEAVLKAVVRTQTLPLDANGKAPPVMIINFKPK